MTRALQTIYHRVIRTYIVKDRSLIVEQKNQDLFH